MAIEDPNDLERVDHEIRINELKHEAERLAGGEFHSTEFEKMPQEIEEQYWKNIVAYERGPLVSTFKRLVEAGVELPSPEALSDEQITAKLREMIESLTKLNTYLEHTDHLSDRQLYEHLWHHSLREESGFVAMGKHASWHMDTIGSYGDEETRIFYRYYAKEDDRRRWQKEWPDYDMPPHEDPPFDRDRFLPKRDFAADLAEGIDDLENED